MYFAMAVWYTGAAIGAISIFLFIGCLGAVFDEKHIHENVGYRNYFLIMGSYALVVMPTAATFANGMNDGKFLFCLGCLCPAVWVFGDKLIEDYRAKRLAVLSAIAATAAIPTQQPDFAQAVQRPDPGPAYVPAPSTLAADFDVPPQR